MSDDGPKYGQGCRGFGKSKTEAEVDFVREAYRSFSPNRYTSACETTQTAT